MGGDRLDEISCRALSPAPAGAGRAASWGRRWDDEHRLCVPAAGEHARGACSASATSSARSVSSAARSAFPAKQCGAGEPVEQERQVAVRLVVADRRVCALHPLDRPAPAGRRPVRPSRASWSDPGGGVGVADLPRRARLPARKGRRRARSAGRPSHLAGAARAPRPARRLGRRARPPARSSAGPRRRRRARRRARPRASSAACAFARSAPASAASGSRR